MAMKRFKGARYITKGIQTFLKEELQLILWDLIDGLEVEKDYLQVFKLQVEGEELKLTHRQEEPDYVREYRVKLKELSLHQDEKVFVIDDGEFSTMMFSYEY